MVKLGENLLKLVEFPFAYSLIGVLVLTSGKTINFEEISFAEFAPLLILIGFLGTALSIIDPFGRLIKFIVRRSLLDLPYFLSPRIPEDELKQRVSDIQKEIDHLHSVIQEMNEKQALITDRLQERDMDREERNHLITESNKYENNIKKVNERLKEANQLKSEAEKQLKRIPTSRSYEDILGNVEETSWISKDIEKNIGMFYFASVLLIFIIVLPMPAVSEVFSKYFNSLFNASCPTSNCFLPYQIFVVIEAFCIAGFLAVTVSIVIAMLNLRRRSYAVTIFQAAKVTNLQNPYVEEIEKHLNSGDWGLALFYASLLSFELRG